jgi:hypothetical protein
VTESKNRYKSEDAVEAVVRGFENCTLPASQFDHPSHLTVALSYLHCSRLTVPEATERMRAALYRFLDHHGHDPRKYNQTITLFWVKLVRSFLDRTNTARPIEEIANEMIKVCGKSQLIYDYYSKERLSSEEAREGWVEPDVKVLDF